MRGARSGLFKRGGEEEQETSKPWKDLFIPQGRSFLNLEMRMDKRRWINEECCESRVGGEECPLAANYGNSCYVASDGLPGINIY